MAEYELSPEADKDLEGIFEYTLDTWGIGQAHRYKDLIVDHFIKIAGGKVQSRTLFEDWPDMRVTRCEHHYIFFHIRKKRKPLIVAVLHERMNLLQHLRRRLHLR